MGDWMFKPYNWTADTYNMHEPLNRSIVLRRVTVKREEDRNEHATDTDKVGARTMDYSLYCGWLILVLIIAFIVLIVVMHYQYMRKQARMQMIRDKYQEATGLALDDSRVLIQAFSSFKM